MTKNGFKFIVFFLTTLLVPVILNFILQLPSPFNVSVIGNSVTWLSFWASFIGTIASFAMIAITITTLRQNKSQLDEMRRQWEEEHRPHLTCRIIVYKKAFFLQIHNPSNYDASNMKIKFGDDLIQNLDNKFQYMYANTSQNPVYISAGKSWNSMIGWCEDINKKWKDKAFNIVVDVFYNEKYSLQTVIPVTTFVNRINMVVQSPLEDYLEDLSTGLVKPHSVANHRTVQVSLEEMSRTLNQILSQMPKPEVSE